MNEEVNRPQVQIESENKIAPLRRHLEKMLPEFEALPGVVGLTLNGGLSRGYADHLSEIDVTIYLTSEAFEDWRSDKPPISVGITRLAGQLYDIKYVDFTAESARDWDDTELWDASYAEILFDPEDLLHSVFAEKLAERPEPGKAGNLLMSCWWFFRLAGDSWIHRGDVLQGHHVFNQAVTALVQALFVANQEYIPHEKWLLHLSRSLGWTPENWEERLRAAMSTGDLTVESLKSRQVVIASLWREIDRYIIENYYPYLPVHMMQKTSYERLKLLAKEGSISKDEWQMRTGSGVPSGDPFYPIFKFEDDELIFDLQALLAIDEDDMYDWHYEVLRAVRRDLQEG